jgi:hypothetical protein
MVAGSECYHGSADQEASPMLYAGLDLSRKRVDVCLLDEDGECVTVTAAPPDADGLRGLAERLAGHGDPIYAARGRSTPTCRCS